MIDDVPSESKRVRRLFRERFTFQISVDTSNVLQGLAVAEAALKAGVTVLELGTPLLKYEGSATLCRSSGSVSPIRCCSPI
jgi:hypothetical protein